MTDIAPDHFKLNPDGTAYAGDHTLLELWGARRLNDPEYIAATLREAALAAGATVLHDHFHHFGPEEGVSGVLVLAESHISIHTWPERAYAAVDIFMCGNCDPANSVKIIKQRFCPSSVTIDNFQRGRIPAQERVA